MKINFFRAKPPARKIGVLYVCTGKYHIFWDKFYKSAKKNFCKNSEVHYFVFTEHPINTYGNPNVHHIFQPKLGWPFDTLKRFHLFIGQREQLEKMDYLFFFNANMEMLNKIKEEEIIPDEKSNFLVSVLHYYFYDHKKIPPFESNPESVAFVNADVNSIYHQGCLSGGRTKEYLEMGEKIIEMVDEDLSKSIIGIWWDESYMNRYFQEKYPKSLPSSFAYPQGETAPMKKRILMFDKGLFGGHNFLRDAKSIA